MRLADFKRGPLRPGAKLMLEIILIVIAYFVVVNFVFPRFGIQPG